MNKVVKIKIVGDFNSTSEALKDYFSSFLHCSIPSSMPCPYCSKVMVRPDRYKKEWLLYIRRWELGVQRNRETLFYVKNVIKCFMPTIHKLIANVLTGNLSIKEEAK